LFAFVEILLQGFSLCTILLKYLKVIHVLLLALLVSLSRYVGRQTPGVLGELIVFDVSEAKLN